METWRRVSLLLGASLAVWLFYSVSLAPVVTVEPADFARMQRHEAGYSEEGRYLRQLPLSEYVEETTRDRKISVSGETWAAFFRRILAASTGDVVGSDWHQRVSRDQRRWQSLPYRLFFRPWEQPLARVAERVAAHGAEGCFLCLEHEGQDQYLALRYRAYSNADFQLGSGLVAYPSPPLGFLYPYRSAAPWLFVAGVAAYFLIPWKKREPEAICYPYPLVALGDLAAMILFVPFFALPMLVVGGAVQALTTPALFLTIVLWPLAFAGAWLALYMAEYESYQILVQRDGVYVATCRRQGLYRFDNMEYWEPLELRPPRWLIALLWLASLAGKGARRYQSAGQAMMLSGSSMGGAAIRLKNGSAVYLWITAQMGDRAAPGVKRLLAALDNAGVPRRNEVRVIESVTMPDGEGEAVGAYSRYRNWALWAILLAPLAAIVATALCMYLGNTVGTARFSSAESRPDPHGTAIPGKLSATGLVWEKTIRLQEATVGQSLIETPDGGLLVCALTWQPGGAVQLVGAVGTDRDGEVLWSKTYGDTRINHVGSVVPAKDHGYFLVGLLADRIDLFAKQQMCIRKLSATGDLQWERLWSANEEDSPRACDAVPLEDGGAVIWGCSERKIHRLQLDAAGATASARTYDLGTQVADARLHWVGATTDGGCIATGQIANPGAGFIDLLLVRLTPSGQVAWHRAFGGKRKESGVYVRQAASGGFVAAGVTHSGESRDQDVYVVLADGDGSLLWEKSVVTPGSQSARRVSLTPEGGFLVVGESQPTNDARPLLFLVELRADGTLIGQQQIGRENVNYTGADAMVASDGSRLLLGTRSLREFSDEVVLVKLSAQ